jgi:protoporphyrinogen oxidase
VTLPNTDWTDLAAKLVTFLTALLAAWLAWRQKKQEATLTTVHELVNSRMGSELLISMVSARTLAIQAPTPENLALAKTAEEKYIEHQQKQAVVDAKTPNPKTL